MPFHAACGQSLIGFPNRECACAGQAAAPPGQLGIAPPLATADGTARDGAHAFMRQVGCTVPGLLSE